MLVLYQRLRDDFAHRSLNVAAVFLSWCRRTRALVSVCGSYSTRWTRTSCPSLRSYSGKTLPSVFVRFRSLPEKARHRIIGWPPKALELSRDQSVRGGLCKNKKRVRCLLRHKSKNI